VVLWRRILGWPGGGGRNCGWRRISFRIARTALLLVVCSVALVMSFERRAIYRPTKAATRDFLPITVPGIEVEEVWLDAADGVRVYAWFVDSVDTNRAMLYFHGNSGNIFDRRDWILSLAGLGVDVMVIDYRGYGLSEGSPTEPGLYADAEAAYRYLADARGVPTERIVVYGKSLGGGPACEVARRHGPGGRIRQRPGRRGCAGLILMSAFTNIPDMANRVVPVIPAGWFTRERFDNLRKVAEIETPKLIIHSRADELVPFRMGEALYEAAAEPKRCLWFDEGGHSGLCFQKRQELLEAFGEFLEAVVPEKRPPTPSPDHPRPPRTGRRPP
jgi:fermentation-respiration switch protein FrsA (DUF1100 family)